MDLIRKLALVATIGAVIGCHDVSAPRGISGMYILETVNGRPVPAIVTAEQTDTVFMLSATLTLDSAGGAHRIEHWRYVYPPNHRDEGIFDARVSYRIEGDKITVGSFTPCPANALCEGNRAGRITSTTLSLAYENNPNAPVFLYRLAPTL